MEQLASFAKSPDYFRGLQIQVEASEEEAEGIISEGKAKVIFDEEGLAIIMKKAEASKDLKKGKGKKDKDKSVQGTFMIVMMNPTATSLDGSDGLIAIFSTKELKPGLVISKVKIELYKVNLKGAPLELPSEAYLYVGWYSAGKTTGQDPTSGHSKTLKVHEWVYQVKYGIAKLPFQSMTEVVDSSLRKAPEGGDNEDCGGDEVGERVCLFVSIGKATHPSSLSSSREQLRAFANCIGAYQSSLFNGAQQWIKKLFQMSSTPSQSRFAMGFSSSNDNNSSPFLKWINTNANINKKAEIDKSGKNTKSDDNFVEKKNKISKNKGKLRNREKCQRNNGEIRIEIKPQKKLAGMEKKVFKFRENDVIDIKITMFAFQNKCSQLEVDLVQSFVCVTETDKFRRRIAKVLKRDVITNFEWEKGITSNGDHFAVHWSRFQIPLVNDFDLELEKFILSDFKHELRMRFFGDDDSGQTFVSACSFPINIGSSYLESSENSNEI